MVAPPTIGAPETHPCMRTAIGPGGLSAELKWDLCQMLEGHQRSLEVLLKQNLDEQITRLEEVRLEQKQLWDESFQHLELGFMDSRAMLDATALKLQRQEECLEDSLSKYMRTQQQATGSFTTTSVTRTTSQTERELEATVARIQAKSDERFLRLQEQSMDKVQQLIQGHPMLKVADAQSRKYGDGTSAMDKNGERHRRSMAMVKGMHSRENVDAGTGGAQPPSPPSEEKQHDHRDSSGSGWHKNDSVRQRLEKKFERLMTLRNALDFSSAALIVVNCCWMGHEAEVSLISRGNRPAYISVVDSFFAICFCVELAVSMWLQGKDFWKFPAVRFNILDVSVVVVQVLDFATSVYNISWLRAIRIVRLLNALRILRKVRELRHLRFLVAATMNSLESLAWIIIFLTFVLFVSSIFILQSTLVTIDDHDSLPPELLEHYGSVLSCMLTLFKAVSGGAPWEELLAPLKDVSAIYVFMFLPYWMFVSVGCFNHFTAIFLENMKAIVRRDDQMQTLEALRNKEGPFYRLRQILQEATREENFSAKILEEQMNTPRVTKLMRGLGLEAWTMVGVFQEIEMEALGLVEVEEYVQALIKLQTKSEMLDLSSVMADNKRILRRLLAFMRFSEDHFNEIFTFLGMEASGVARPQLSEYLPDKKDLPTRDCSVKSLAGDQPSRNHSFISERDDL